MSGAANLEALISQATDEIERASIPPVKTRKQHWTSNVWPANVERCIEHTLLKRERPIGRAEIIRICNETRRFDFLGVCIDREHVPTAKQVFKDTTYIVVAVVGFPSGNESTAEKVKQTKEAIQAGADEIDMVIAVNHLKAHCYQPVFDDIQAVVRQAGARPVKVILETALIDDYEKVVGCLLAERAGAAFVKTSTGFAGAGARVEDVALMKNVVGARLGVKAAGGIRDLKTAWAMIEAGADRLGTSSSVHIVKEKESENSTSSLDFKERLKYAWDTFSYQANQRQQNFNFFLLIVGALLAGYFKVHETRWYLGELMIALMGIFFSIAFWFLDLRNAELVHCARKELVKLELQAGVPIRWQEGSESQRPQLGVDMGSLAAKFYRWKPGLFRHFAKFKFWFKTIYAVSGVLFLALTVYASLATAATPATPKKPVTDVYHGVKVVDDYRWLEDVNDPAVRAWSAEQNRYARSYLDALPARASLYERLKQLRGYPSPRYLSLAYRRDMLFAIKRQPPKEQPFLVALASPDAPGSERVIVDPNQLDAKGTTAIDFYVPSVDGKYVAVSLSQGGSESGDVHVYEVAGGKPLADVIPRVNGGTAGGSVAWNADGSGFYYTRYPRGSERPKQDMGFYQQVYFHRLGTKTEADTYSLGKGFPRIAEIALESSEDGRYILATMANGDGGEFAHHLLGPDGEWRQITRLADRVSAGVFGLDGSLYLLSRQGAARGKILRLSLKSGGLAEAQAVVPESRVVIQSFLPTAMALYVSDLAGGPSQVRIFDLGGHERGTMPVKAVSAVGEMVRHKGDEVLFESQSYTDAPAWYRFEPSSKKVTRTALYQTAAADFSDVEVTREFATSADGAKIPLNIIARKGTQLGGNNPTVLYGYGGYGVSLTPGFSIRLRPLLDRGVIYVIANLRGGGEYGEDWHDAGKLTHKQNVFDDFAAAARHLIERKYTSAAKLAIEGGSNGGLLMGAAFTQHPELYRAVVSHVGIYDMLRVELHPNGAFNVTEFGTVKELDQFRALYAYSPYHHVVDGTQYPTVFFLTGDNDPRVDPANSRKMTARLQASGAKRPVLLRTSGSSGHGIGTALSEVIAADADVFAFLFDQLGVK